jgi:hypothetical protein
LSILKDFLAYPEKDLFFLKNEEVTFNQSIRPTCIAINKTSFKLPPATAGND